MFLQHLVPVGKAEVGLWDKRDGQAHLEPNPPYWTAWGRMRAADAVKAETLNKDRADDKKAVVNCMNSGGGAILSRTGTRYNFIFAELYNLVMSHMSGEGAELQIYSVDRLDNVLSMKVTM